MMRTGRGNVLLALGSTIAFLLLAEGVTRLSGIVDRRILPAMGQEAGGVTPVSGNVPKAPSNKPHSKYVVMAGAKPGEAPATPTAAASPKGPLSGQARIDFMEVDPELSWRLRRGYRGIVVTIESHGLRGDEVPAARAPSEWRLLLIGDSVTFGWGVGQGDTYGARLEALLRIRCPGLLPRVMDAGVPGYTLEQGEIALRQRLPELEPDAVLICFGNVDRLALEGKAGFAAAPFPLRGLRPMKRMLSHSHFYLALRYGIVEASARLHSRSLGTREEQLDRYRTRLARMVKEVKAEGHAVYILAQPHVTDGNRPWNDLARDVVRAEGATFVDVPLPLADPETARGFLLTECHPNAEGHQLMAEAVAAAVGCPHS